MIPHGSQVKKLLAKYGVKFAYLFGSRANGKGVVAASDYDLAVFFGTGTPQTRLERRLKLMAALQELFAPFAVDLIALDDTHSATLRHEVIGGGKLIYTADEEKRIDFEFRVMHEYEDFAPFLKLYNKAYMAAV